MKRNFQWFSCDSKARVVAYQHGRRQEVIGDPAQSGEMGTASTLMFFGDGHRKPIWGFDGLALFLKSIVEVWFKFLVISLCFPPSWISLQPKWWFLVRETSEEFPIKIVFHLPGSLGSFFSGQSVARKEANRDILSAVWGTRRSFWTVNDWWLIGRWFRF